MEEIPEMQKELVEMAKVQDAGATPWSRRAVLGAGAGLTVALLAACGSNKSADKAENSSSDTGSTESADAKETKLRDDDGYHYNEKTDGAPVVTLFTDYQCPYCKKGEPAYEQAAGQLAGTMNVTVRHFPLSMHQYAVHAACAVQAAENQDQHLAMAHKVFENQETWETAADNDSVFNDFFLKYAEELGLNTDQFTEDYNSDAVLNLVKQDYEAGQKAGVKGTPSFVVDGRVLENVDSATSAEDMVAAFKSAAGL